MKYIIIGLGNYGRVLAEELSALGHEIIGADISESRVDSIKDKVALLKQKKVAHIYARAIDMVHKAVLEAFSLEKILTPEEDAARSLVQLLDFGTSVEAFRVDSEYYVVKFTVPKKFVGYFVNELNLDEEFHLKLIGLKRADKVTNCLGISLMELHVKNELPGDEKVEEGDELVCYGKYRDFQSFWKAI